MSDNQPFDPTATSIFGLAPVADDVEEAPVALSARDREAVEALPAGSALLIVQRGPNTGARFLLDPEVTNAGRSPRADIFLDDVTVSRKHCQFIASHGRHIVRDSGSLNGTYVNRQRVEQCALRVGDEVRLRIEGFDRVLGVVLLLAKRVSYPQARTAYDDRTPERPRVHIPVAMREKGSGRPTKKERRELDRLRGYDSHEHY